MNEKKDPTERAQNILIGILGIIAATIVILWMGSMLANDFAGKLGETVIYWLIIVGPLSIIAVILRNEWSLVLLFPIIFWTAINVVAYIGIKLPEVVSGALFFLIVFGGFWLPLSIRLLVPIVAKRLTPQ